MNSLHTLIRDCVQYLDITSAYSIRLESGSDLDCVGYCETVCANGFIIRHDIVIFLEGLEYDQRNIETLVAHEFIHAWQFENNIHSGKHHCKKFVKMANRLEAHLKLLGYPIENTYIKAVDSMS